MFRNDKTSIGRFVNGEMELQLHFSIQSTPYEMTIYLGLPRAIAIFVTRASDGQIVTQPYQNKYNLAESIPCQAYGKEETMEHILIKCSV